MTTAARNVFTYIANLSTGVMYCGSMTKMADITDGTSNTYLVGEKYIDADYILTGQDGGDNEGVLMGDNMDIDRFADPDLRACRPCRTRRALPAGTPPFRQRPRQRIPDGLLRRLREDDELLNRVRDPPPAGQPQGRPGDQCEEVLGTVSGTGVPDLRPPTEQAKMPGCPDRNFHTRRGPRP